MKRHPGPGGRAARPGHDGARCEVLREPDRYSRKTLANILATLAKLLRTAVDWDVLREMPCKIKIPKSTRTPPTFYEQSTMLCLIDAAAEIDPRTHALVLLGLHGGLRRGEILGLECDDVNMDRRQLVVRRNVISRYVDTPKSGHGRVLDLSGELAQMLKKLASVSASKSGRVFRQDSGRPANAGFGFVRLGGRGEPEQKYPPWPPARHDVIDFSITGTGEGAVTLLLRRNLSRSRPPLSLAAKFVRERIQ